jgi:hypothetical protein
VWAIVREYTLNSHLASGEAEMGLVKRLSGEISYRTLKPPDAMKKRGFAFPPSRATRR